VPVIFLDANVFLRAIVQPTTPATQRMAQEAQALFLAVKRGDEEVTTSEVVLHEVVYVLASKAHYGRNPADIAGDLAPILRLRGLKLPRGMKRLYLRALELYVTYPKLGYADAIVAAHVEQRGIPLATFDSDFDPLTFITRWQPPAASGATTSPPPRRP
jgi:predicted nucleic acid-binding protein